MTDLSNDVIIHQKKDNIEYLQFRKLLEYTKIVHCYTLSTNDFDIAGNQTYETKKEIVHENYKKLSQALQISSKNIIRPYQTHTDVVECIKEPINELTIFPKELTNVDGLLTNQKDIFFSLTFADCTPIYLYDPVKNVVGNIHSGWMGTLKGIGKVAVSKMIENYGCNPKDIICCFGPHIHKCHFEVGKKVAKDFKNQYANMKDIDKIIEYIGIKDEEEKYHIDTTKINENLMLEMELLKENIIDSKICTVCDCDSMHSYRAKSQGRNTALIGIKK